MGIKPIVLSLLVLVFFSGCNNKDNKLPTIGFVDAFEDSTLGQARQGFLDALREKGFDEAAGTVKVIYRNAEGNIPVLTQIVNYFASQQVTLIASCPSLSTITALQNAKEIPVFMMVSPTPELMNLTDADGKSPANLFGVGENLAYIDTSFAIIPKLVSPKAGKLRVGVIFNQSEPQSVDALERLKQLAAGNDAELVALPVNATADVQLVTGSLLNRGVDAFFANPDNTVFGAFETIIKACNEAGVPVFTSEAGLVARGAVAAFGADMYQWGHQSGEQAAAFLKSGKTTGMNWEMVKVRKRVFNPEAAQRFGIAVPDGFEALHQ